MIALTENSISVRRKKNNFIQNYFSGYEIFFFICPYSVCRRLFNYLWTVWLQPTAGIKKQMPSPVFNNGIFFQITVPFWKFVRSRGELLIFFLILCHHFEIFRVPVANYWYFSHKHGTIFQKYAVFFFRMLLPSLAGHHFSKTLNYFSQMPHFCLKYAVIFPKCPFPISGTALFFRNAAFWFKMRHFFS